MTTFTPLPSKSPKSPKWGRLFSVAVALMLVGGGILLFYAATRTKNSPTSATQINSVYSTDAAKTLAALQTASTATLALPTDTPTGPTATGFPQLIFTPPNTTTPATATRAPTAIVVSSCNNTTFVSDVTIPDNTVEAPGASFVKTWALQNTGTCTWDTTYKLVFDGGDQMGGAATKLTSSVAPSQQVQVSVSLTAPTTAGTYKGYWILADGTGTNFQGSVTVVIVVSSTFTSTPTGTLAIKTSTPVATKTPTSTSVATAVPPTATTVPPTATAVPPTDTATQPPVATATQ